MSFEWDDSKNAVNISKHGLSFYEAQEAFFDDHRVTLHDTGHSSAEKRHFVSVKRPTVALRPLDSL